jgi:hypothetical protein
MERASKCALYVFLSFRPFLSGVEPLSDQLYRTSSKILPSTPCYELAPFGVLALRESSFTSAQRFLQEVLLER